MLVQHLSEQIHDMLGFQGCGVQDAGWNSHVQREFPGNVESTNLSRNSLSREIGRMT